MAVLKRERHLEGAIKSDLTKKLVFVGGPRQVGKTTMALHLLGALRSARPAAYLNWDIAEHRQAILRGELPQGRLVVFDEIHKYARWRGLMKGFFDRYGTSRSALVTGSARLDHFWDWSQAPSGGPRFLNLVAAQLLKYCHFVEDTEGYAMELRYLRERTTIPRFYQVHLGSRDFGDAERDVRVLPLRRWVSELGLP